MSIKLYNTLSHAVEEFMPLNPPKVGMYACGITVYDEAHIGHASQAIVFDVIRNYLEYRGYRVTYVRNFTDLDDKIIDRAKEAGKKASEISEYYLAESIKDLEKLKVKPADHQPKVTEHIPAVIDFIQVLIDRGFAYQADGDVLFEVEKFENYGRLSGQKLSELRASEDPGYKKRPFDFALWKAAKKNEPAWDSPWGQGRPGWHIECSAMAMQYLGQELDIHGGGKDLLFPHHENEIAQSEAYSGKTFAKYWIHNGLVMVNQQKMSKSLGNFYTIKQTLDKYPADVIRYVILSYQYSSDIDFSEQSFLNAQKRVYYFYKSLKQIQDFIKSNNTKIESQKSDSSLLTDFEKAMDDNFNTAKVIASVSDHFAAANRIFSDKSMSLAEKSTQLAAFVQDIATIGAVLRFLDENPAAYIAGFHRTFLKQQNLEQAEIDNLILKRQAAKGEQDYATADSIRNTLLERGIKLSDGPQGTSWEVKLT